MNLFLLIIVGFSLSMDTFSLSLSLGTFNIRPKDCVLFSVIVGLFHFVMPLIGHFIGDIIQSYITLSAHKLFAFVLIFIAIELIMEMKDNGEKEYDFSLINMIVYAFSVSLDSLTVGIGMSGLTSLPFVASGIFSLISFLFTYLGLLMGKYSHKHIGKLSNIIGLIIILLLAFSQIMK